MKPQGHAGSSILSSYFKASGYFPHRSQSPLSASMSLFVSTGLHLLMVTLSSSAPRTYAYEYF